VESFGNAGSVMTPNFNSPPTLEDFAPPFSICSKNISQLLSKEDGNNSRGRFICSKPMIVT